MLKPVVSVTITTYNLETFVEKTIQSVLDQETDFPFEIVIGDDCSTDGTQDIIKRFQKQYPDIIRTVIFNEKNEGVSVLFPRVILSCKGQFIATLDGDDYWTDNNKLQMQLNYLKNNSEYKICCTDYSIIDKYENIIEKDHLRRKKREKYTISDIIYSTTPPRHTAFFAASIVPNPFPVNYKMVKVNDDHYFFTLLTQYSDIGVLKVNTANYRKHDGGIYSKKPFDYKITNLIITNSCMLEYFKDESIRKKLINNLFGLYSKLGRYYFAYGKFSLFAGNYINMLKFTFANNPILYIKFHYHLLISTFSKKMKIFEID